MFEEDSSRGRSSSPDGVRATEGTEMARLDRGADVSEGGEQGVARETWESADRQGGVVAEESNLQQMAKIGLVIGCGFLVHLGGRTLAVGKKKER